MAEKLDLSELERLCAAATESIRGWPAALPDISTPELTAWRNAWCRAYPVALSRLRELERVAAAAKELSACRAESVRLTSTPTDFDAGFVAHADCMRRTMDAFAALDAALKEAGL